GGPASDERPGSGLAGPRRRRGAAAARRRCGGAAGDQFAVCSRRGGIGSEGGSRLARCRSNLFELGKPLAKTRRRKGKKKRLFRLGCFASLREPLPLPEGTMLHALVMAGGGGTRFWPRSRRKRPKQFLTLTGDRSLLQQVWDRAEPLAPPEGTWIITGAAYTDEPRSQLPSLQAERVVGEPCGRDTAACIGLGAALIAAEDPQAVMLVTPADHLIEPAREFGRAAHVAERMAEEHPAALVTFGIVPTYPATRCR